MSSLSIIQLLEVKKKIYANMKSASLDQPWANKSIWKNAIFESIPN